MLEIKPTSAVVQRELSPAEPVREDALAHAGFPANLRDSLLQVHANSQDSQPEETKPASLAPLKQSGSGNPADREIRLEHNIRKAGLALLAANYPLALGLWSFASGPIVSQVSGSFTDCLLTYFFLRRGERRLQALAGNRPGDPKATALAQKPNSGSSAFATLFLVLAAMRITELTTALNAASWTKATVVGFSIASCLYWALGEHRDSKVSSRSTSVK